MAACVARRPHALSLGGCKQASFQEGGAGGAQLPDGGQRAGGGPGPSLLDSTLGFLAAAEDYAPLEASLSALPAPTPAAARGAGACLFAKSLIGFRASRVRVSARAAYVTASSYSLSQVPPAAGQGANRGDGKPE